MLLLPYNILLDLLPKLYYNGSSHGELHYMIYGYIPKSKPKKLTKAQLEQKLQWLKSIESISPKRVISKSKKLSTKLPSYSIPPGRETPKLASLDTGFVTCAKTFQNLYTGDKIKGIGTMHKSNAVPVFSDTEAKEIASMRR
jgi:hypothetical protein